MPEFLRGPEVIILLLVIILFFGAKRMPDAARGIGRSLRILKAETKGLRDDDDTVITPVAAADERPASLPIEGRAYATEAELRAREAARVEATRVEPVRVEAVHVDDVTTRAAESTER